MSKQKILILGVTGMVGHKLFFELSKNDNLDVYATSRCTQGLSDFFNQKELTKITTGIDLNNLDWLARLLEKLWPEVIINCVGITKQLVEEDSPSQAIAINALVPHLLAKLCEKNNIRLIQMATDCVFNGQKGNYLETDESDATDTYGRTKFLGEVYYPYCLTVRTSFIGHELTSSHGLLSWFLSQEGETSGYTNAIYSGMPTVAIASVIGQYILPNKKLTGLYHVSTEPISKYDLLVMIAEIYQKKIKIVPDGKVKVDRSLNSDRFRSVTGWQPKAWQDLIEGMYIDYTAAK